MTVPSSLPQPPPERPDHRPVLPDRSRDETDEGWGDRPEESEDERILREVPPHHL